MRRPSRNDSLAGSTAGPFAAPGTYTVRVTVGTTRRSARSSSSKRIRRRGRPTPTSRSRTRFALQIRDRVRAANDAVKTIRNVKRQLEDRAPKMSGNAELRHDGEDVRGSAQQCGGLDLPDQEPERRGSAQLPDPHQQPDGGAPRVRHSGERRPPKQSYECTRCSIRSCKRSSRATGRSWTNLPKINAALKAAGQPKIVPSTAEPPAGQRASGDGTSGSDRRDQLSSSNRLDAARIARAGSRPIAVCRPAADRR